MSTHDTPHAADVPEMPAPRVRESVAHSIGGGLALLLGLVGLPAGAGMIVGATAVDSTGGKAALIVSGILTGLAAFIAMCGLNMLAAVVVWKVEDTSERKAAMVSNLSVVLCGDRAPQPVLNTGSLHQ
ncbi:hypothetical protein [Streptomyces sp. NPDC050982]|uniref:hypothetical protein n=1 Tax=Streptomyces sp. NPDC050982 TaxID=3154746 RepID=UPI0033F8B22B